MVAIDAKEVSRAVGNDSCRCRCCLGIGSHVASCERYGPVEIRRLKRSSMIRKYERRGDEEKRE